MSALTKTFVVLHVVLSLLVAAAVVVFANRTEDYRGNLAMANASLQKQTAIASTAKNDAAAQRSQVTAALLARDQAVTAGETRAATLQQEIDRLNGSIAEMTSAAKIAQVSTDNLTAVVNASEAARKSGADLLASTRTDLDKSNARVSDLNLALSDVTQKFEVAVRTVSHQNEDLQQLKSDNERMSRVLADAGIKSSQDSGLGLGAPSINGVITAVASDNGIKTATISVGSSQDVKKGMKFTILSRDEGKYKFLGELTVQGVDSQNATGLLEGPAIGSIVPNVTEVRTRLQ